MERPKNLTELVLRLEQMKVNLPKYARVPSVVEFVSETFIAYVNLLPEYGGAHFQEEYQAWYNDFRQPRA